MIRGLRPLVGLLGATTIVAALPGAAPAAAAASQLVAVVIDFGPGGPAPLVKCVDISGQGQVSDLAVVNEALSAAGEAEAGLRSDGLVCSFDAYPGPGASLCPSGSNAAYWAYFTGTANGWTYANVGPASHVASVQSTVGFRYESDGRATAPSEIANSATQCPVAASVTPTTALPVAPIAGSTTHTTQVGGSVGEPRALTTTTVKSMTKAPEKQGRSDTAHVAKDPTAVALSHSSSSSSSGSDPGGSAVPTVIALGAFALIAGGTAYVVRRRRAT